MKKYILLFYIVSSCISPKGKLKTDNIGDFFTYSSSFRPLVSVHRGGGAEKGIPENSIESFQYYASLFPSIIECDLRLTKDSVLVFLHDETLERTTTGKGKLSEFTFSEIKKLKLKDNFGTITNFTIPKVEDALIWGKGKVFFTLDVKKETPFDVVVDLIEKTKAGNSVVVITYNVNDAKKVNDLNPNLMISVTARNETEYQRLKDAGLPDNRMVAFVGTRVPDHNFNQFLHNKGIVTILGTLGNLDKMAEARGDSLYKKWNEEGADIFSTDRPKEAYEALRNLINNPKIRHR